MDKGNLYHAECRLCPNLAARIEELEKADHNSTAALVRAAQKIEELETMNMNQLKLLAQRADVIAGQDKHIESLSRIATQRGARMQIMRQYIGPDWGTYFIKEYPEAAGWFDEDGVPVREVK